MSNEKMSDIFEHIKADKKAFQESYRILKPQGLLIVFVPAFQFLWSHHDVANIHHRRYNKKNFLSALQGSGFSLQKFSYWNFSLFFPFSAIIGFERLFHIKNEEDKLPQFPPFINSLLLGLLKIENRWITLSLGFPIGISLFAVLKK